MEHKKINYTPAEIMKSSIEYFGGDELAANVWMNKYALRDEDGIYELNPDMMHHRLADEFARIEQRYPNPLTKDNICHMTESSKKDTSSRMLKLTIANVLLNGLSGIIMSDENINFTISCSRALDQENSESKKKNTRLVDTVIEFVENHTSEVHSNRYIVDSTMISEDSFTKAISCNTTEDWIACFGNPKVVSSITNGWSDDRICRIVLSGKSISKQIQLLMALSSIHELSPELMDFLLESIYSSPDNDSLLHPVHYSGHIPASVNGCFVNPNDLYQYIYEMVKGFYSDKPINLALIYRVLDDYGVLKCSGNYFEFINALIDWGILSDMTEKKRKTLSDGIGAYMREKKDHGRFRHALYPGFRQWGDDLAKKKQMCEKIAAILDKSQFVYIQK